MRAGIRKRAIAQFLHSSRQTFAHRHVKLRALQLMNGAMPMRKISLVVFRRDAARRSALSCRRLRIFIAASCVALVLCGSASAQGFPGGSGGFPGGGHHGGHGPPPGDAAHRPPSQQTGKLPEPLEELLRIAHELRQTLMLDAAQTERWSDMQADLRDALDKHRALVREPPGDASQASNPALLFIQGAAADERAYASALDKLSQSSQAAFDALNERQRKIATEKMTAALSPGGPP